MTDMEGRGFNLKAFIVAALLFVALISAVLFNWKLLAKIDSPELLLGAILLSIALITVNAYQSFNLRGSAQKMAQGMTDDITLASRELFFGLFRSSPVPYVLIDKKGKPEVSNVAAHRLFGLTKEELERVNIFDLLESDRESQVALFSSRIDKGISVKDEELRVKRQDGTTKWVMLSLFPYGSGFHKKGLLTLVDITHQKEIDKAKTEFVSLASHQLRTPISAIKWNLELLQMKKDSNLDESERALVEKLDRNIKRMDAIVSDFLNVSRLELGTLEAKPKNIELGKFLGDIFDEHMARIKTKNISVKKEYDEDAMIMSDPHLLRMVIGNLISNATKYTPEGGTITVSHRNDGGGTIFEVADTGVGIPEDEQEKLFTKLFRASNVREQMPDGTGLGLYIVEQTVKVLGGKISFISEKDKGSTFTVVLPQ